MDRELILARLLENQNKTTLVLILRALCRDQRNYEVVMQLLTEGEYDENVHS